MLTRHLTKTTFVSLLVFSCAALQVTADDEPKAADNAKEPAPGTPQFVERALRKTVSISAVERPLIEVMENLEAQVDVGIHFDTSALDSVGIGSDTPVTVSLEELPLRSALGFILDQLELSYTYHEGVVMITTPEAEEQNLQTKTYEVVDLVSNDDDMPQSQYDYDSLIDAITRTLGPRTWDNVGGPGLITGYRGTIVVAATQEVHQQVARLLTAMRRAKEMVAKHQHNAPPRASIPISAKDAKENDRIEKVLDSVVAIEFLETPLSDVVVQIERKYKLNVFLDVRALDAVGLGDDTPVTNSFRNVKLRQALRLLLRDLELTFSVRDGVLLITTPEEDELNLITRLYPILDLVDIAIERIRLTSETKAPSYHYASLIDLTRDTIAPTMWANFGGAGSLAEMDAYGFFVVSQTYEIHRQIESLYAMLRQKIPEKANSASAKEHGGHVRLAVYVMPEPKPKPEAATKTSGKAKPNRTTLAQFRGTGTLGPLGGRSFIQTDRVPTEAEMLELITTLIEPESWNGKEVYARALAGRIIVRHEEAVHRQIQRLAFRLGLNGFHEYNARGWESWAVSW